MLLLSEGQAGEIFKNIDKRMHINVLYWHSAHCVGVKKVVHLVTTGIRMLITNVYRYCLFLCLYYTLIIQPAIFVLDTGALNDLSIRDFKFLQRSEWRWLSSETWRRVAYWIGTRVPPKYKWIDIIVHCERSYNRVNFRLDVFEVS